jgi:hydrogenase-1 operon protein HyaF
MAWSVLTEISQLLNNLSERGENASISLRGLPMTGADREQLEELLGRGEVHAELDLSGKSEVWETRYPGVWWIRHQGLDGKIACEEIAITPIPDILKTHPDDIRASATRLVDDLARTGKNPNQQSRNETPDMEMPNVQ